MFIYNMNFPFDNLALVLPCFCKNLSWTRFVFYVYSWLTNNVMCKSNMSWPLPFGLFFLNNIQFLLSSYLIVYFSFFCRLINDWINPTNISMVCASLSTNACLQINKQKVLEAVANPQNMTKKQQEDAARVRKK